MKRNNISNLEEKIVLEARRSLQNVRSECAPLTASGASGVIGKVARSRVAWASNQGTAAMHKLEMPLAKSVLDRTCRLRIAE